MLDTLITSKTRVKLLMKFFLNPGTRAYLRELASEFDESTNSVRVELNRLSEAKIISDCGHMIIFEKAFEMRKLVKEFILKNKK